MKKPILLSVCLLAASLAFAQNYLPMSQENAHWIMYAIGENGADHYVISVQGDTTINGLDYKKLWWRKIHSNATSAQQFQPPFYYDASATLLGALRDDTTAMQVFYIPFSPLYTENDTCDLFDEWLIYDFSIQIGDTIGGCLNYRHTYPYQVVSITTEQLWGEDRKVVFCDEAGARLIEGVGTGMGPLWQLFAVPHPAKPTFLYDYCVGEESFCGLQLVNAARERLANWQIELYPNPATDLLTIQLPEGLQGHCSLTVSDFSGKKIFEKNAEPGLSSLQLSVNDLPAGLYLLTVRNENSAVSRRFAKL